MSKAPKICSYLLYIQFVDNYFFVALYKGFRCAQLPRLVIMWAKRQVKPDCEEIHIIMKERPPDGEPVVP